METLVYIAAMVILLFLALRLARNYFLRSHERQNDKLAEAYRKAVEKHKLSENDFRDKRKVYNPPSDRKVIYRSTTNDPVFNPDVFGSDNLIKDLPLTYLGTHGTSIGQSCSGETTITNVNGHYSSDTGWHGNGAVHGGSFGGGGASGSWGSDDSTSSSYSDSSSDSGGSDSSSSD